MTKNALIALDLLKNAKRVEGFHASDAYNLNIDFINKEIEDEDDIIVSGKFCTVFMDDLNDCAIHGNTIYIRGQYVLHAK